MPVSAQGVPATYIVVHCLVQAAPCTPAFSRISTHAVREGFKPTLGEGFICQKHKAENAAFSACVSDERNLCQEWALLMQHADACCSCSC